MPLIIDSAPAMARALGGLLDDGIKRLLALRWRQNDGDSNIAHFIIAHATDAIADIEGAIGYPLLVGDDPDPPQPVFDWAERHGGGVWEVVIVLSDDGPVQVLVASEGDGNPDLIRLLQEYAASDDDHQRAAAR